MTDPTRLPPPARAPGADASSRRAQLLQNLANSRVACEASTEAPAGSPRVDDLRQQTREANTREAAASKSQPAQPVGGREKKPRFEMPKFDNPLSGLGEKLPEFLTGKTIVIAAAVILVIGVAGFFTFRYFSGGGAMTPEADQLTPSVESTPYIPQPEVQLDDDWWAQIRKAKVVERSPGRLGHLDQMGIVAQVLGLALVGWLFADVMPRRKSQRGVIPIAVMALAAGILTLPLLNLASVSAGWTFLTSLFLLLLWAAPVYSIVMHNDNTALAVALALFGLVLFDAGVFSFPAGLALVFDTSWKAWQGITSIGGILQLIMALRFREVALTILMFATIIGAMLLASHEVGKRYGGWVGAAVAGVIMLILWALFNWLLFKLVIWLVATQNLTTTVVLIFEILRPIVAWLTSVAVAVGVGVSLGDLEVEIKQNKIKMGLSTSSGGGWAQTTADFAVLATVFALAGVLVLVL